MKNIKIIIISLIVCFSYNCSRSRTADNATLEVLPEVALPPASEDQDTRPIIVAFGNSLTSGLGVEPTHNYPAKLQAKLNRAGYHYRIINSGVRGDTSAQGLNRIEAICALRPSITIVEFGANDGLRGLPIESIRRNLTVIIEKLQSAGSRVILAGMQIPPNYGTEYTSAFRQMFPELANKQDVDLIPFFLDGVGGYSELNQDDGIHPTAEGYDIVVENVWKVLKPLL